MGGDHLWEAIGAVGEIVGAVAVVVTLGYLAAQIRAETHRAQLQAQRERTRRISDINLLMADSDHLPGLLIKLSSHGSADSSAWKSVSEAANLDPEDAFRYAQLRQASLRGMQETILDPTLDASSKTTTSRTLRLFLAQEGEAFKALWRVSADVFHPDFRNVVDESIDTYGEAREPETN